MQKFETRADFVYDGAKTVIYVDGPIHDYPERRKDKPGSGKVFWILVTRSSSSAIRMTGGRSYQVSLAYSVSSRIAEREATALS